MGTKVAYYFTSLMKWFFIEKNIIEKLIKECKHPSYLLRIVELTILSLIGVGKIRDHEKVAD